MIIFSHSDKMSAVQIYQSRICSQCNLNLSILIFQRSYSASCSTKLIYPCHTATPEVSSVGSLYHFMLPFQNPLSLSLYLCRFSSPTKPHCGAVQMTIQFTCISKDICQSRDKGPVSYSCALFSLYGGFRKLEFQCPETGCALCGSATVLTIPSFIILEWVHILTITNFHLALLDLLILS